MKCVLVAPLWLSHYSWVQRSTILCKLHQESIQPMLLGIWVVYAGKLLMSPMAPQEILMTVQKSKRKPTQQQCLSSSSSIPGELCQEKNGVAGICFALTCPCFKSNPYLAQQSCTSYFSENLCIWGSSQLDLLFIELWIFCHHAQRDTIYLMLMLSYLCLGDKFTCKVMCSA